MVLKPDTCPNGDYSPSYYDGVCSSLRGSEAYEAIQNNEHNSANEVVPPEKSGLP
jgi:hypothetical protein